MTFTQNDFEAVCMLADGQPAMIIQINSESQPFDIAAQVPGEADARYIEQDKFERVRGIITQVKQ